MSRFREAVLRAVIANLPKGWLDLCRRRATVRRPRDATVVDRRFQERLTGSKLRRQGRALERWGGVGFGGGGTEEAMSDFRSSNCPWSTRSSGPARRPLLNRGCRVAMKTALAQ